MAPAFLKKKYVNPATMTASTSKTIFCNRCFSHFRTENSLAMHSKLCNTGENVIRVFPNKGETLSYTEHQYNYKRIYTGYADFESLLKITNNIQEIRDCESIILPGVGTFESGILRLKELKMFENLKLGKFFKTSPLLQIEKGNFVTS